MGATPLYLAIILAQANTYLRESATLHLNGTVERIFQAWPDDRSLSFNAVNSACGGARRSVKKNNS